MPAPTKQPYGISLPITRGDSGYFGQTFDIIDQIKFNLMTLLKTKKGERRMNPMFGSDLYGAIFEFNTDELKSILEDIIRRDIQRWMPQLNINDVEVTASNSDKDNHVVNISVIFTVESIGITQPQSVEISIVQPNP